MTGKPESARKGSRQDSTDLARAAMIARRFYLEGETKQEIAKQLGISRFKVARLLDVARSNGLIRIEINSPVGFDLDLAKDVRERFGLVEVWVVNQVVSNQEDDREPLGLAAAPIVSGLIEPGEVVGIGWGRTLSSMVDNLPSFAASTIVQIAGGVSSFYGESPSDLPRRLVERFGVESYLLHAPLFLSDPATASALRVDTATAATLAQFRNLTTIVIGVAAWAVDHPAIVQALDPSDIRELDSANVVGHSLPLFFDRQGQDVDRGTAERAVGITLSELLAVPRRTGIAGGRGKATAIEAVLKAGVLTHLVTDVSAAEVLISS